MVHNNVGIESVFVRMVDDTEYMGKLYKFGFATEGGIEAVKHKYSPRNTVSLSSFFVHLEIDSTISLLRHLKCCKEANQRSNQTSIHSE